MKCMYRGNNAILRYFSGPWFCGITNLHKDSDDLMDNIHSRTLHFQTGQVEAVHDEVHNTAESLVEDEGSVCKIYKYNLCVFNFPNT